MVKFDFEHLETQEKVRKHIQNCEGRHTQQVCYSTFHDALTQIDFDEKEEKKIEQYSTKWEMNKPKTVRRMVLEFQERGKDD